MNGIWIKDEINTKNEKTDKNNILNNKYKKYYSLIYFKLKGKARL